MKSCRLTFVYFCLAAVGVPFAAFGDGYSPFGVLEENADADESSVEIPVRFADPDTKASFSAKTSEGTALQHQWLPFSEKSDKSTAYLFLIDVSDFKARNDAITKKMRTVEELLKTAEPHHQAGVSVFAASLKEVAPVGTPHAALIAKMKDVKEGDLATLLYGSMSQAIDALAKVEADRKALVLMSDGKAEDPEVTRTDVTEKALEKGIVIYSIGYVERAQDKKNLQGMQLMAAATGGPFVEASPGAHQLQPEFAEKFYQYLENGGNLEIDTSQLNGRQTLLVEATTESDEKFATSVEHTFPEAAMPDKGDPADGADDPKDGTGDGEKDDSGKSADGGKGKGDEGEAGDGGAKEGDGKGDDAGEDSLEGDGKADSTEEEEDEGVVGLLKKYWWALALGLVALLAAIIAMVKMGKGKDDADEFGGGGFESSMAHQVDAQPTGTERGWLETLDEPAARFPIYSSAVRIGRGQDNDIRLSNDSVSKHHAEIQIDREGIYRITDLNSGNGVFVNGNRVSDSELDDGDVIELGDIRLRLTTQV